VCEKRARSGKSLTQKTRTCDPEKKTVRASTTKGGKYGALKNQGGQKPITKGKTTGANKKRRKRQPIQCRRGGGDKKGAKTGWTLFKELNLGNSGDEGNGHTINRCCRAAKKKKREKKKKVPGKSIDLLKFLCNKKKGRN